MPHSLSKVYIHLVFATVEHLPFLAKEPLRQGLYGYMAGIFRNLECPPLWIGGAEEHVHVLFRLSRPQVIAKVVQEVKSGSTTWLMTQHRMGDFDWQDDYGAFSVSPQYVDRVVRYIKSQGVYHQKKTYEDEYRELLRRSDGLDRRIDIHVIFSTKNRFPFLTDSAVRLRLHEYLERVCLNQDASSLATGGVEDHVHLLYRFSPDYSIAQVVQDVKKSSSQWLAKEHHITGFDWQDGYGAFSVSPQDVPMIIRYVKNQEAHHRRETFLDERDRLLDLGGF